eukprot:TRINITY_DN13165_c0_g1_i1.p2 TRINITY_DN13165_c0_g1~~TRINITY_DN13165_c0_g1_i1.p2  ORF type:complete len:341 (+),score=85.60 TRINITY_DN13165_c0_g1_i1:75-1097(+)
MVPPTCMRPISGGAVRSKLNPAARTFDPRKGQWYSATGSAADMTQPKESKKLTSHAALALLVPALMVPSPQRASGSYDTAAETGTQSVPNYRVGELVVAHGLMHDTALNSKKGRVRGLSRGRVQVDFGDHKCSLSACNLRHAPIDDDDIEVLAMAGPGVDLDDDDQQVEVLGHFRAYSQPLQPLPSPSDAAVLAQIGMQKMHIEESLRDLREQELRVLLANPPSPPPPEDAEGWCTPESGDSECAVLGAGADDLPPPLLDDDDVVSVRSSSDHDFDDSILDLAAETSFGSDAPCGGHFGARGRGGSPTGSSSQGISPEVSPRLSPCTRDGLPCARSPVLL